MDERRTQEEMRPLVWRGMAKATNGAKGEAASRVFDDSEHPCHWAAPQNAPASSAFGSGAGASLSPVCRSSSHSTNQCH